MIKDPIRRAQLANLSLIACGIMPATMNFLQLSKSDLGSLLWQTLGKPEEFGLTYEGNKRLIELFCEELEFEPEPILEITEERYPNQTEFHEGTAFLQRVAQAVEEGSVIGGTAQDVMLARLVANVSPDPMKEPVPKSKFGV